MCDMQKERGRSKDRMKGLEGELARMKAMQGSLHHKLKVNSEVGCHITSVDKVRPRYHLQLSYHSRLTCTIVCRNPRYLPLSLCQSIKHEQQ